MKYLENHKGVIKWAWRAFLFSWVLAAVLVAPSCIQQWRMDYAIRQEVEYSDSVREKNESSNMSFVPSTYGLMEYEKNAEECQYTDIPRAAYIRNFKIPMEIRMADYIFKHRYDQFLHPEVMGAWLSSKEQTGYDDDYTVQNEELKGNGFLLHVTIMITIFGDIMNPENQDGAGFPDSFHIEFKGFPPLDVPLGDLPLSPFNTDTIDEKVKQKIISNPATQTIYAGNRTFRVWLQFPDKPIPAFVQPPIQECRIGHAVLPENFPRQIEDLFSIEGTVSVKSGDEKMRQVKIQYDVTK